MTKSLSSPGLTRYWPLWLAGVLVALITLAVGSAVNLLRLPNLPNCRAIFWPTATAATRLQCAEAYAAQGTVEAYLEAIALVQALPDNHPLRQEIDQRLEAWSRRILDLAEQTFQSGELEAAITTANRIPSHTAAATLVQERVQRWQGIWQQGETLYQEVETQLAKLKFQEAFSLATQLLGLDNTYWKTTRYEELTTKITRARQDLNNLGRAKGLARQRTLTALKEAISIAQAIPKDSPVQVEAQRVLASFGQDLLAMATTALERRQALEARQMLDAIPPELNLVAEITDMNTLIEASQLAWQDTVVGLEAAIIRLQSLGSDRPLYGEAQSLISDWQAAVQGRSRLDWAQQLALGGTTNDLYGAMAEAQQISRTNPIWPEAKQAIADWRRQVETLEDQPILNQAEQLAVIGNLPGAIATTQQIPPGRALSDEAEKRRQQWRQQQQRAEDTPRLSQAQQLAAAGRLTEAIALAESISPGRPLSDQAQAQAASWRQQVQDQQNLAAADRLAQRQAVNTLLEAIALAQQVPEVSPRRAEARQRIDRWSLDLLRLADQEASLNLERAIAIARQVPIQTEAYALAQLRLRQWQPE
ncbi:MAG: chromosome segregation ATPase [Cyanobacteriota bacterium]|nr:chromosome segregation ATPase [Cyanobacteriota bacterium]